MSIAVIIVNYRAADLAIAAVDSVLAHRHGGRAVEVHLVDNASPGDDAAVLTAAHRARGWGERVTLWLEAENHGFGRGNNLVLAALAARGAPPDYVFLLNPDARLENEALDILATDLDTHPGAAVTGAAIRVPDGTPVAAAFRFPNARGEIAAAMRFGPLERLIGALPRALPPDTPAGPVDWVSGASMMMRFSAVAEAGFFDPAYFLYYEEVDLMRRLTAGGWHIRHQPAAIVMHIAGVSTGVRSDAPDRRRRPAYLYRSWRRYFTKAQGRGRTLALALGIWVGAALGRGVVALRGRETHLPLQFFRDHFAYLIVPLAGLRRDADYDADTARFATRRRVADAEVADSGRGHPDPGAARAGSRRKAEE